MGQTDTRVAVIGIIVENPDSVGKLNDILTQHREKEGVHQDSN